MKKFEYDVDDLRNMIRKQIIGILDGYGKHGWELISIDSNGTAYFKREMQSEQYIPDGGISLREMPKASELVAVPEYKGTKAVWSENE